MTPTAGRPSRGRRGRSRPESGWMGGWGIIAADILVMASLAQIAGQYVFDLFNANGIGDNATSGWVLLVGIALDRRHDVDLLRRHRDLRQLPEGLARDRAHDADGHVGLGTHPSRQRDAPRSGTSSRRGSWFNPFAVKHFSDFVVGLADMLFIYWGWDTAVSLQRGDRRRRDDARQGGRHLDIRLARHLRPRHPRRPVLRRASAPPASASAIPTTRGDVLSILGPAIFGHSTLASILDHLLVADGALVGGGLDADDHPAHRADHPLDGGLQGDPERRSRGCTSAISRQRSRRWSWAWCPSRSTWCMNYLSAGQVIKDSVDSLGVMIAFYYGLTGFSCAWYYRKNLTSSVRNFFMQGVFPTHRRRHPVLHPRLVLLVLLAAGEQLHAPGHLRPPDRRRSSSSTSGRFCSASS